MLQGAYSCNEIASCMLTNVSASWTILKAQLFIHFGRFMVFTWDSAIFDNPSHAVVSDTPVSNVLSCFIIYILVRVAVDGESIPGTLGVINCTHRGLTFILI